MAFPPSFIDELIARNPIEDVVGQYVTLKRSGANMFGLCPFKKQEINGNVAGCCTNRGHTVRRWKVMRSITKR